MAIAHLHAGVVKRSAGRSAVAAAAYAARTRMIDMRTGEIHDYSRNAADVVWQGVFLPKGVDLKFRDLAAFANALEAAEKRPDAQTARTIELALPHELTPQQRQWLVQDYGRENFTRKGLGFHVAIHQPHAHGDQRNHHAHFTIAMRQMDASGFHDSKDRTTNEKQALETWRENWEKLTNRHLERHGHEARISMKTLKAQGIDRSPQIHLGQGASAMLRKGITTDRAEQLWQIANDNQQRAEGAIGRDIEAGEPEAAAELELIDRDAHEVEWQEAIIDAAIAHEEEKRRQFQEAQGRAWEAMERQGRELSARHNAERQDMRQRHEQEEAPATAEPVKPRGLLAFLSGLFGSRRNSASPGKLQGVRYGKDEAKRRTENQRQVWALAEQQTREREAWERKRDELRQAQADARDLFERQLLERSTMRQAFRVHSGEWTRNLYDELKADAEREADRQRDRDGPDLER